MILPSAEASLGALRLRIDGSWSVEEFQSLLFTLNDVYKRVAAVMTLGDLIRREQQQNAAFLEKELRERVNWFWSDLYWSPYERYYPYERFGQEPLPRVLAGIQPLVSSLDIDAIKLQSPGWLQVIGNLNPLKVIADFISKWRAENTKRLQIKTTAATERERVHSESALERERMLRAFALEVLRQLPDDQRGHHANRLAEVAEYAIVPSTDALKRVADDVHVIDAEIVSTGTPLPDKPPRHPNPKP